MEYFAPEYYQQELYSYHELGLVNCQQQGLCSYHPLGLVCCQ